MPLTISIAPLRRHHACGLDERIADLRRVLPDVAEDDPVPLRTWWDLPTTTVPDRIWSLRAVSGPMVGRVIGVRVACLAARRVLRLTRERDRAVCLAAIEAAEAWATGPTVERAIAAGAAARRAADTAYIAFTHAIYAAIYAARAASYAHAAGSASADAARRAIFNARAADAAEREAQRADLDRLLTGAS